MKWGILETWHQDSPGKRTAEPCRRGDRQAGEEPRLRENADSSDSLLWNPWKGGNSIRIIPGSPRITLITVWLPMHPVKIRPIPRDHNSAPPSKLELTPPSLNTLPWILAPSLFICIIYEPDLPLGSEPSGWCLAAWDAVELLLEPRGLVLSSASSSSKLRDLHWPGKAVTHTLPDLSFSSIPHQSNRDFPDVAQ